MKNVDRMTGRVLVGFIAALVASCGGGDAQEATSEGAASTASDPQALDLADADPSLVSAEERRAMAAADTSLHETEVRYLVTLNPAAVADVEVRSATVLTARANGQSRTAAAVRTLAASTVQGLEVRLQHHFAQALQGYAVAVTSEQAPALLARLRKHPAVKAVELDRLVRLDERATEERAVMSTGLNAVASGAIAAAPVGKLWGLDRIDQRSLPLDAQYAPSSTGQGVTAYVIDSGIAPHAEFGARLATGANFVLDGRSAAGDCNGHGTHVAGTVGGATHGVAPAVTLASVRVLGCDGSGTGSGILNGIEWVLAHAQRPAVANFSIGMSGPSAAIDEAIESLARAGITPVVAAGNSSVDACLASPARTPGAITVGASDMSDAKASFSNFGACLDLFAPGVMTLSAGHLDPTGFVYKSGTSMAAPHVTGAAALWLASNPGASPAQVAERLVSQATPGLMKSAGTYSPNKLLFVGNGLANPVAPPDAVRVEAMALRTSVLSPTQWTAAVDVTLRGAEGRALPKVNASIAASSQAKGLTCTTGAAGQCTVLVQGLSRTKMPRVTFAVTDLKGTNLRYWAAGNKADVMSIDAPVGAVYVQGLSAEKPTRSSTYWQGRATATVRNTGGFPVSGLKVSGLARPGNAALSCTTAASGSCVLTGPRMGLSTSTASFLVTAVDAGADPFRTDLGASREITLAQR